MRAATYTVDDAECVVYFFGAGQGGTVQANLDRWKNQFQQAGGQPAATQIKKRAIHGLPVTTIETSGDYSGMGGPLAEKPTTKSGYRLLGAIVEGPLGNVFLKFVGPAKTIAANEKNFEILLSSFEKR
jgi:hypothetical protein